MILIASSHFLVKSVKIKSVKDEELIKSVVYAVVCTDMTTNLSMSRLELCERSV